MTYAWPIASAAHDEFEVSESELADADGAADRGAMDGAVAALRALGYELGPPITDFREDWLALPVRVEAAADRPHGDLVLHPRSEVRRHPEITSADGWMYARVPVRELPGRGTCVALAVVGASYVVVHTEEHEVVDLHPWTVEEPWIETCVTRDPLARHHRSPRLFFHVHAPSGTTTLWVAALRGSRPFERYPTERRQAAERERDADDARAEMERISARDARARHAAQTRAERGGDEEEDDDSYEDESYEDESDGGEAASRTAATIMSGATQAWSDGEAAARDERAQLDRAAEHGARVERERREARERASREATERAARDREAREAAEARAHPERTAPSTTSSTATSCRDVSDCVIIRTIHTEELCGLPGDMYVELENHCLEPVVVTAGAALFQGRPGSHGETDVPAGATRRINVCSDDGRYCARVFAADQRSECRGPPTMGCPDGVE